MPLAPYRDLLRLRGVGKLVAVALIARVPHAMTGMIMTLHVVGPLHGSYAQAGVVSGVYTVGIAIGGPWRGRMVDRQGLRRALIPSILVESACWIAVPFCSFGALVGVSLVAGAFMVPVFSVVRQSLGAMVPLAQHRSAFALDSVSTELTFMMAPLLAVWIVDAASTNVALVVLGVTTVGAGALLLWLNPPTRSEGATATAPTVAGQQGRLITPAVVVTLAATVAAMIVLAGTDVSLVAALRESGRTSDMGWMFALWSVGSAIGGLVYGAGRRSIHPLVLVVVLAIAVVPAALVHDPVLLAIAIVVAGLPCAPTLSTINSALVRLVPEHRRGEVMGWSGTAMTVGTAMGSPLCGAIIDSRGASAGFMTAAVISGVVAVAGLLVLRIARASVPSDEPLDDAAETLARSGGADQSEVTPPGR